VLGLIIAKHVYLELAPLVLAAGCWRAMRVLERG
jgi:hypothetical protein